MITFFTTLGSTLKTPCRSIVWLVLSASLVVASNYSSIAETTPVDRYTSDYVRSIVVEDLVVDGVYYLAARFQLKDGYHIYWQNPGDSGLEPRFELERTSESGSFQLGSIEWPLPDLYKIGPFVNYGYSGSAEYRMRLLFDEQAISVDAAPSIDELIIDARWLVCQIDCVSESARLRFRPNSDSSESNATILDYRDARLWRWSRESTPPSDINPEYRAIDIPQSLPVEHTGSWHLALTMPGLIESSAEQYLRYDEHHRRWRMWLLPSERLRQRALAPEDVGGQPVPGVMLALETPPIPDSAVLSQWRADSELSFTVKILPSIELGSGAPTTELDAAATKPWRQYLWVMLLAFVGGLLLNAMPCVLPVLTIKMYGLTRLLSERKSRRTIAQAVTANTVGILTLMLILAGAVLGLREAGHAIGWGFQLHSATFVLAIGIVMLLVALNFSGVYTLSSPKSYSDKRSKRSINQEYFLSGLLIVVLATPCTAPFMATAMVYAWQQEASIALSVFAAIGLGLASPLWLLPCFPRIANIVPKPGNWMIYLQRLLAFPVYATVLWLLWVLSRQVDTASLAWALTLLWLSGLIAWAYGAFYQPKRNGYQHWRVVLTLVILLTLWVSSWVKFQSRTTAVETGHQQVWSIERQREIRARGQPLLINFTAAWCATCLWNEQRVFSQPEFIQALSDTNTTYLIADWTKPNENIARALESYRRLSIPVYAYYPPGPDSTARLLGQLPELSEVIDVLRSPRASAKPATNLIFDETPTP